MDRSTTMMVVESGDYAVRSPTRWGEVGDEVLIHPRQGQMAPHAGRRPYATGTYESGAHPFG
jgi:hypothetical protein